MRISVDSVLNVMQAAADWNVRRVTAVSSIGVYGGVADLRALHENQPLPMTAAGNPVAGAKKTAELLSTLVGERLGFEVVNPRLSGVWGPLGRSSEFRERLSISGFVVCLSLDPPNSCVSSLGLA